MTSDPTATIAVLSAVHGNTPALRAVLADIERREPDLVVNLGDLLPGGVDPAGTATLLRTRPDIMTVAGNHERQALTLDPPLMGLSDRLAHDHLDAPVRAWLGGLTPRLDVLPDVLAFHGTPTDDRQYLLQTVDDGLREASDAEVVSRLGDAAGCYGLYLCGHTHLQRTRRLPDGSLVVNPGNVGWPAYDDDQPTPHLVEAGTPHARFSVVQRDGDRWRATEHAIEYDVDEAVALAEHHDRPDVAHALRTGRVAPAV